MGFGLIFILSIYSGFVLAKNSRIIRPDSSFVEDINCSNKHENNIFCDQDKGNKKFHDESVQDVLLSKVKPNQETQKNSDITTF